ncbi:hypothetical protein FHS91_003821 [Sphingobium xanthum]|uniref:hypothetical protein n=1 Tax=Sphingobium xanthum TaxID=1387165 RepID=UPI001C8C71AC|nr:hypothetical protein [Sphingobium xanthum]
MKLERVKIARSNGQNWLGVAIASGLLGGLAVALAMMVGTYSAWWLPLVGLAALFLNTSVLALVTGSIIRALWFLPGQDVKESAEFDYVRE